MKKKIISILTAFVITLSPMQYFGNQVQASGLNTLYEHVTKEQIVSGINYENKKVLTPNGSMNVHVLLVDLNNPNIQVQNGDAIDYSGKRDTTTNLLANNGLVAGVNASFFDVSLSYTSPLGIFAENGQIYNITGNTEGNYYTLYADQDKQAMIGLIQSRSVLYTGETEALVLSGVNTISRFDWPIYIDQRLMKDTAAIDGRYSELYKIVIEDDVITYISNPGETVNVPEYGRGGIVVFGKGQYNNVLSRVKLGDIVTLKTTSSVDLSQIDFAISGGGRILENGAPVSKGLVLTGRHPRTAVGITKDKKQLILMVVDGRGASIGATHAEMGALMLSYGAYDAMHFDGGGSSTLAYQGIYDSRLKVVNRLSDGSQRNVTNVFGAVNTAPLGTPTYLSLKMNQKNIFQYSGEPIQLTVLDENYKVIESNSPVQWKVEGVEGRVEGNRVYLYGRGKAIVTATVDGISQSIEVNSLGAPTAIYSTTSIKTTKGKTQTIALRAVDKDKRDYNYYYNAKYEVIPATLGTVEEGLFTALENGSGVVKVTVGNMSITIPAIVGMKTVQLDGFETEKEIITSKYPENVPLVAGTITNIEKYEKEQSLALAYQFSSQIGVTQAAYYHPTNMVIPAKENGGFISMWVKGDQSKNLLRMRLEDGNQTEFTLNLSNSIDWSDWKYVQAVLPQDAVYPVTVKSIYVAALKTTSDDANVIYFDHINLNAEYTRQQTTNSSGFRDEDQVSLKNTNKGLADIAFFGTILDKTSDPQKKIVSKLTSYSDFMFGNKNSENTVDKAGAMYWSNAYNVKTYPNTSLINLTLAQGSLYKSQGSQIRNLEKELNGSSNNIIIYADKNPMNTSDTIEGTLIKEMLEKAALNKNIVIISPSGSANTVELKNGIRYFYIDKYVKDEALKGNKYLVLRLFENDIKYEFLDF